MSISSPLLLTSLETPFWIFWIWIWIIPTKTKTAEKKNLEISPFSGATSKILHQLRLAAVHPIIFAPVLYILSVAFSPNCWSINSYHGLQAICEPPFLRKVYSVFSKSQGKMGGGNHHLSPPPEPCQKKTPTFHWLVFFGDPDLSWVYQNPQKKPTWVGCHPHTFLKPPGSFFHCSPDHFYQPRNQSTEYALRSWRIKATWARGETRAPKKTQGGFGC